MGSDAVHEPEREQKTSRGLGAAHSGTLVCRRLSACSSGAVARTGLRLGWPDPEIASARANGERLGNADHAVEDLDGDCNFALLAIG